MVLQGITERVNWLDDLIFRKIYRREPRHLTDALFLRISKSADGPFYATAALLLMILDPSKGWPFLFAGIAAFGVMLPKYRIIKTTMKRKRPCDALTGVTYLVAPPDQFSFPSGHTAGAFIIVLLGQQAFPELGYPLVSWAGMVAVSRVYLGVHYPTDTIAGVILGLICGKFGITLAGMIA